MRRALIWSLGVLCSAVYMGGTHSGTSSCRGTDAAEHGFAAGGKDQAAQWLLPAEIWGKSTRNRDVRFGLKVGQIGPKWDKCWTFSDKISVHFGSLSQNVLKSYLKKSSICTICGQSNPNDKYTFHWRLSLYQPFIIREHFVIVKIH